MNNNELFKECKDILRQAFKAEGFEPSGAYLASDIIVIEFKSGKDVMPCNLSMFYEFQFETVDAKDIPVYDFSKMNCINSWGLEDYPTLLTNDDAVLLHIQTHYWYGKEFSPSDFVLGNNSLAQVKRRVYTIGEEYRYENYGFHVIIPSDAFFSVSLNTVEDIKRQVIAEMHKTNLITTMIDVLEPCMYDIYKYQYGHLNPTSAVESMIDSYNFDFGEFIRGQQELQKTQLKLAEYNEQVAKYNVTLASYQVEKMELEKAEKAREEAKKELNREYGRLVREEMDKVIEDRENRLLGYQFDSCAEPIDNIKLEANNDPIPCNLEDRRKAYDEMLIDEVKKSVTDPSHEYDYDMDSCPGIDCHGNLRKDI